MDEPGEEIGDLESDGDEIEVREGCDDVGPLVREPAHPESPAGFRTQQIHDRDVRLVDELAVADVVYREARLPVHGLRKRCVQMLDESKLEIRLHRVDPEVWRDRGEPDVRSEADGVVDVVARPPEAHRHEAALSRKARSCLTARSHVNSRSRTSTCRAVSFRMLERAPVRSSSA